MAEPAKSGVAGRDFMFDNLKALAISLVVIGHLLESTKGPNAHFLYTAIYLFHMPLFVFCTGYFSKYSPEKILTSLVWPYVVFQVLYQVFARTVLDSEASFSLFTPYWILWYLLSAACWYLLIPFFENRRPAVWGLIIAGLFAVGLFAGYDKSVGRTFSLSRTVAFLPFFALGRFARDYSFRFNQIVSDRRVIAGGIMCFVAAMIATYFMHGQVKQVWLHASGTYASGMYSLNVRGIMYAAALVMGFGLICMMPRRRFWFSYVGQNTLAVYLLHGFLIKIAPKFMPHAGSQSVRILTAVAAGLAITLVMALPAVKRLVRPLFEFPGKWLPNRQKSG